MSEIDQKQEKLSELENKIIAVLKAKLEEATKNRDAITGPPGFKPRILDLSR